MNSCFRAALRSHTLATLAKHVAALEIWSRNSDLGLIMVHEDLPTVWSFLFYFLFFFFFYDIN